MFAKLQHSGPVPMVLACRSRMRVPASSERVATCARPMTLQQFQERRLHQAGDPCGSIIHCGLFPLGLGRLKRLAGHAPCFQCPGKDDYPRKLMYGWFCQEVIEGQPSAEGWPSSMLLSPIDDAYGVSDSTHVFKFDIRVTSGVDTWREVAGSPQPRGRPHRPGHVACLRAPLHSPGCTGAPYATRLR